MSSSATSSIRVQQRGRSIKLQLDQLPAEWVDASWSIVGPILQRALDKSPTDLKLETIKEQAMTSRMAIWVLYDTDNPMPFHGVAASGVRQKDGATICEIYALAGHNATEWIRPVVERFEDMAREHGVDRLYLAGRRGWSRILPEFVLQWRQGRRIGLEKVL